MQRLMLETTVWRYLQNNLGSDEYYVQLDGFPVANLGAFLYKSPGVNASDAGNNMYLVKVNKEDEPVEGTMTVTGTMDSTVEGISNFPTYTANFSSGKGEELYDFHVDFGKFSQLRLTMGAFSGTTDPITVKTPASEGHMPDIPFANRNESNKVQIEVTSIITQTSISWDDPLVEKGGAEA